MRILVLDNYDSFTWNLVHLFEERGADVHVFRNDAISVGGAEALAPDRLVISPGPGRPEDAGVSVQHDGHGVFAGLPEEIEVGRYHSLAATDVPAELVVTAHTDDGEVMGVRHRTLRIEGVQFHPESVLTPTGGAMADNFLRWSES